MKVIFFPYRDPLVSESFVEKTYSSLNYLGTFVESQLTTSVWIYFWTLKMFMLHCHAYLPATVLSLLKGGKDSNFSLDFMIIFQLF